jgi:hypothetical protein
LNLQPAPPYKHLTQKENTLFHPRSTFRAPFLHTLLLLSSRSRPSGRTHAANALQLAGQPSNLASQDAQAAPPASATVLVLVPMVREMQHPLYI